MEYLSTIALTLLFTILFLVVYKYVINPQILLRFDPTTAAQCPDAWNFNPTTGLCDPGYKTECYPFDPKAPSIQSASAKCNLARTCGTTWSGMCG